MNQNEFFKKLFKYVPGRILVGVLGFLPIILLTKLLDPSEYGEYKMIYITLTFIAIFTTGWLDQAIIRFWHNFQDKTTLYATVTFSIYILNSLVLIIFSVINYFFNLIDLNLFILVLLLFFSRPIFNLNTSIYRNMELLKRFNQVEIIRVVLNIFGILLLVPYFGLHGAIFGIGFSYFIVNIISISSLKQYTTIKKEKIKFSTFKELFFYGYPLIFTMLSSVIISYSDQFIIGIFHDSLQVGIYAANYDILEKILLYINSILVLATTPKLIKIYDEEGMKQANKFNSFIYMIFIAIFLPFSFLIITNDYLFISVFTNSEYFASKTLITLIIFAMFINTTNMYVIKSLTVIRNTKLIANLFLSAMVLNVILNFILIPKYSFYGAISATIICYIVLLFLSITLTRNKKILTFNFKELIGQGIVYFVIFMTLERINDLHLKFIISSVVFLITFIFLNRKKAAKFKAFLKK